MLGSIQMNPKSSSSVAVSSQKVHRGGQVKAFNANGPPKKVCDFVDRFVSFFPKMSTTNAWGVAPDADNRRDSKATRQMVS
jgi:hypothetical protein